MLHPLPAEMIAIEPLRDHAAPFDKAVAAAIEQLRRQRSTDTDFARFSEIRWENPLQGR